MTWPTVAVDTTDTDSGTDNPANARADLLDALQKLNQIIAHVSTFAATVLDDADAAAVRSTLGAPAGSGTSTGTNTGDQTNVSGSAATVTAAAQPAVTSTGVLITDNATAMGTGSGTTKQVGVAHVNTTAVGNVGAGEDDLMTYSLPANSLSANGKGIRITAYGVVANNANAKTINFRIGASTVPMSLSMTTSILAYWRAEIIIMRSASNVQKIFWRLEESQFNTLQSNKQATGVTSGATETDTAAIAVKFTGTATANDDITQNFMLVEFLN